MKIVGNNNFQLVVLMIATEMVFVGYFPDNGNVHAIRHILARTVLCQSNPVVMMVLTMITVLISTFITES